MDERTALMRARLALTKIAEVNQALEATSAQDWRRRAVLLAQVALAETEQHCITSAPAAQ